jgi:sec-independent protein translocase protein TatA
MPNIGPVEIIIVLVIVLLIFGPKRLPDLGRSLGRGMREFKDSVTGNDDDKQLEERHAEQAAPVAPPAPVATTADEEPAPASTAKPADAS